MTFSSAVKGPDGAPEGLDGDRTRQDAETAIQASARNPLGRPAEGGSVLGNKARGSFATAFVGRARGLGLLCRQGWARWRKRGKPLVANPTDTPCSPIHEFDILIADAVEAGLDIGDERHRRLMRSCIGQIWQSADHVSDDTADFTPILNGCWLIEALYSASTRLIKEASDPVNFGPVVAILQFRTRNRATPVDPTDLLGLLIYTSALLKFAKSQVPISHITFELYICSAVCAIAGLRALMGDRPKLMPPIFTLAGPIQRDLEEKTTALADSLAELHTARAQVNRQSKVITQQDDHIHGLEARNIELTRHVGRLQQELKETSNDFLQSQVASLKSDTAGLTTQLEEEQLTVLDLRQKLQALQPVCDARVRAAEAIVAKQNNHIQYLKGELRTAGVPFNENWGVGHQGRAA